MAILIVEDELLVAADIQSVLENYGFSEILIATNYSQAIDILETSVVHLAVLDIHLAGYKTGIDVANYIKEKIDIPFVFLSAYEDMPTLREALDATPNAYLQKPFGKANLYSAIQLALNNYSKNKNSIDGASGEEIIIKDAFFVKDKSNYVRIPVADVQFIRSDGNYLEINTLNFKKYLIRATQKSLLQQLPEYFTKVHKSYIINTTFLVNIGVEELKVAENIIPIAATYREELMQKLKTFS